MLKRSLTVLLFSALLFAPAAAGAQEQAVNDEEVMQAASAIFTLYLYGAAGMQYGQIPEGISYNEEAKRFEYEKVDLTGLSEVYTLATGTITREAKNQLHFDFTLTGGPVSTITYRIARDPEDDQGRSKPMDIEVNGSSYRLSDNDGERGSGGE